MTFLRHLPEDVVHLIRAQFLAQYATVSTAGVPIDTPTLLFASADLSTLDVATGLAYPAKAERARKNPKAGLLIEGKPDQPVVSVAGVARVRDGDLQANLDRYMAETILTVGNPEIIDWSITNKAIWYFTRIIVCIAPTHVRWWKNRAAMDEPPQEWRAPSGAAHPASDPVPPGTMSDAPRWPQPPWHELAVAALARKAPCHLTLLDAEGYPLPIPVRDARRSGDGFSLVVPKSAPWSRGKATLSFEGREIFVGDAMTEGAVTILRVERALPVLPLTSDISEVLQPKPGTQASLRKRLEYEAARRSQPVPTIPRDPPEPTAGARYRHENMAGWQ